MKLKYDEAHTNCAFNFNLRHYIQGVKWEGGLTVAVPKHFLNPKKNTEFKELYLENCSFGKGKKMDDMGDAAFARAMKNSGLIDGTKLSSTGVDIIFTKVKGKGKLRIGYEEFLSGLAAICGSLNLTFEEVAAKFVEAGAPKITEASTRQSQGRATIAVARK